MDPMGPPGFPPIPARGRLPVAPLRAARPRLVSGEIREAERFNMTSSCSRVAPTIQNNVKPGLDPGIQFYAFECRLDYRVKPGNDPLEGGSP